VGFISQYAFKRGDRLFVVSTAKFRQADVQPDPCHLRREPLRCFQILAGLIPIFPAHRDDAKVSVRSNGLRVERKDTLKRCFGALEVTRLKGHLSLLKPGLCLDWVSCLLSRARRQDTPPLCLQGTKRTGREKERHGSQQDSQTEFHFFP